MAVATVLIDTNAYAAYKRGDQSAVEIFRHVERIGISTIVLGELLAGFAAGIRERRNRDELQTFLDTPRIDILSSDQTTADYYAKVYLGLRKRGRPIPTNDLWIAATALQHGMALYTLDRHFAEIDGLLVVDSVSMLFP